MSDFAYAPLTTAETIFKQLIWDPCVLAGEAALFTAVPVLNAPLLGTLIRQIIGAISNFIFTQVRLVTDLTAIRLVNAAHQAAYDQASLELKIIAHDQGVNSDAFSKARDEAKLALDRFIRTAG